MAQFNSGQRVEPVFGERLVPIDFVLRDSGPFNHPRKQPALHTFSQSIDFLDEHCAALVAVVIVADTGLSEDEAMLLATGLTGMAQTSARRWLRNRRALPKATAAKLIMDQVWGGISAFPRSHPRKPPPTAGRRSNDTSARPSKAERFANSERT